VADAERDDGVEKLARERRRLIANCAMVHVSGYGNTARTRLLYTLNTAFAPYHAMKSVPNSRISPKFDHIDRFAGTTNLVLTSRRGSDLRGLDTLVLRSSDHEPSGTCKAAGLVGEDDDRSGSISLSVSVSADVDDEGKLSGSPLASASFWRSLRARFHGDAPAPAADADHGGGWRAGLVRGLQRNERRSKKE